jgi:kinesin family protein 22
MYRSAVKRRKTASTNLNSSSSRSHAILTLYLEITENGTDKTLCGKICVSSFTAHHEHADEQLTDLAGSENNKLTGNDKERTLEVSQFLLIVTRVRNAELRRARRSTNR